jgi:hypothetical protein
MHQRILGAVVQMGCFFTKKKCALQFPFELQIPAFDHLTTALGHPRTACKRCPLQGQFHVSWKGIAVAHIGSSGN